SFAGMEKLGKLAESGYTLADLTRIDTHFKTLGCQTKLYNLHSLTPQAAPEEAWVLVISKGLDHLLPQGRTVLDLWNEQIGLNWDRQALMWGRVVNKKARYNLCWGPTAQEPDYA